MSRRTQVEDGEPAIAEHGGFGHNNSSVVRPATLQAREHGLNNGGIFSLTAITVDACNTTHVSVYVELPSIVPTPTRLSVLEPTGLFHLTAPKLRQLTFRNNNASAFSSRFSYGTSGVTRKAIYPQRQTIVTSP